MILRFRSRGRTGRSTLGLAGYTFDYDDVSFGLAANDGGTISFSTGNVQVAGTVQIQVNDFRADDWTFPNGNVVHFAYQMYVPAYPQTVGYYHLSTVTNSLNRELSFAWDQNTEWVDIKLTVTDDSSRTVISEGQEVTDPLGNVSKFLTTGGGGIYGNTSQLTKLFTPSDQTNAFVTFGYDDVGRIKTITDKSAVITTYYPGKIADERFARGESVDALGGVSTVYFDKGNRPLQTVDEVGRATTNVYDGLGRLVETIAPEGNSTEYEYDVRHNRTVERVLDKNGSDGLVTTTTYFTGSSVFICPANDRKRCNQPTSVDGPRTDVTDATAITYYQATGLPNTITGPAVTGGSPLTTYTYTSYSGASSSTVSLLTSKTEKIDSSTNVVTTYGYDTLTNHLAPISFTVDLSGLNLTTNVAYDSVGNVVAITNPKGKTSRYCFDLDRRLTRVVSQVGTLDYASCTSTPPVAGDDVITNYTYNTDSLLSTASQRDYDPITSSGAWRTTTYAYTATQLLETITDPQSNVIRYDYDVLGRTSMVTDPAGRKTRTFYFADGKVRKELRAYQFGATSTNEDCTYGSTLQQCYARYTYAPSGQTAADYNGQVYSIEDANGNTTTYSYDAHDRRYDTTFPDSSYERNVARDGAGNVTTFRNRAGESVASTYDALNRQVTKSHSSFPAVTYGYDLLSRQTSVAQAGGQAIGYVIDKAGRPESTTAGSRTVSYIYDDAGNRERITWPDAFYITYTYDDANRMNLVKENGSQVLADYDYDTASRRRRLTRGNGDATTYTYEADSDLAGIAHTGLPNSPTFTFGHNAAHQITSTTISDPTLEWVPSANATTGYVPNVLNQYSSVGGVTYGYDAKGNLTSDGASTFTYDAENRLLTALVGGTSTTYAYDGLGRR